MTTLTATHTTDVRRALLTTLVALPWSLGWLAGALVTLTLYAVAAVRIGFTDARQSVVMTPTSHAGAEVTPGEGRGVGRRRGSRSP